MGQAALVLEFAAASQWAIFSGLGWFYEEID
jgi:hypothetical protein